MKNLRTCVFILASAAFLGVAAHSIYSFNKVLDGGLEVKLKPSSIRGWSSRVDFSITLPYKGDLSFVNAKNEVYYGGYRNPEYLYILVSAGENGFLKPLSYSEKPVKCGKNEAWLRLKLNKVIFKKDGKKLETPKIVFNFKTPPLFAYKPDEKFKELEGCGLEKIIVSAKIKDGVALYESLAGNGKEFLKRR